MRALHLTLTLILGLLAGNVMANHGGRSVLVTKFFDNGEFAMNLNGQRYHTFGGPIKVTNLRPGNHNLVVVRIDYHGNRKVRTEVFRGRVNVPPATRVKAKVTRNNRLNIVEQVPLRVNRPRGRTMPTRYTRPNGNRCGSPIANQGAFNTVRNAMLNASFDSRKLTIATQFLANNGVTSRQVLELMDLLTFESNKLELAKIAYASTVDPQNYFVVNNGFTYNSSVDELSRFIR